MNHSFIHGDLDKTLCKICRRNFLSHTKMAECEACSHRGDDVNLFGPADNPKSMLLCATCTRKEIEAAVRTGQETEKLYERAKEIDHSIKYNGDFFNAKVIATESVRSSIMLEEGISEQEKHFKFQSFLAERYEWLKKHIFELDELKHQDVTEVLVIEKSLREFGNEVRKEIQEKIKATDQNYQSPVNKTPVKPRVNAVKKSPMEKLIEALALAKGISKEQASEMIMKGKL
jgi:hypothetical protein